MTAETIKLLLRHGLTALGAVLIAADVATEDQIGQLINAIADGVGAASVLAGLYWSWRRKRNRGNGSVPIKSARPVALFAMMLFAAGCGTLDKSGPYAGDAVLYNADLAIVTSYDVLHKFVQWEYENRAALAVWPEVKQAADTIRRDAPGLINSAIALREVYAAAPSNDARASLQTILRLLRAAMTEATKHMSAHNTSL